MENQLGKSSIPPLSRGYGGYAHPLPVVQPYEKYASNRPEVQHVSYGGYYGGGSHSQGDGYGGWQAFAPHPATGVSTSNPETPIRNRLMVSRKCSQFLCCLI